jgi:POT family proton-dependent oligopeptide transporter
VNLVDPDPAAAPSTSAKTAATDGQSSPHSSTNVRTRGAFRRAVRDATHEVIQPIRDFSAAPRALNWGVNVPYFIEGLVYFGTLTVLTKFLSENVAMGDIRAGQITAMLTGGITGAMFLLGELSDRWGVRRSLLFSMLFLIAGRAVMAMGETLHLAPGAWGSLCLLNLLGMGLVVVGYGAYQPAAYAAVKQYTTAKTAAMGYAMLYALQNLGSFASGLLSPKIRHLSEPLFPPNGITGVLWLYTALTVLGMLVILRFLPRLTTPEVSEQSVVAKTLGQAPQLASKTLAKSARVFSAEWLRTHPLADAKFSFFIFVLIPVQTLFAHNWLTMPLYIERAFRNTPWVSENFEFFSNLNPLLIFVLTPLVTALTARMEVYRSMIFGTAVMALPTFLLVLGPTPAGLLSFTVLMSVGEAFWQPRFLQYVAEIAPEGKTGLYMGVAQFPWFLTKLITGMYSGWFLHHYCPAQGPQDTKSLWFIYSLIACASPIGLLLAKNWAGKAISARSQAASEAAARAESETRIAS